MSHGWTSPCPCKVLWRSVVLWVLWSLSLDRNRRRDVMKTPRLCDHRRRWPTDCYLTANLQLQKRIHNTRASTQRTESGCMYVYAHTYLCNSDPGFVWVTITQGEMLTRLKCVWVITSQSTLNNIRSNTMLTGLIIFYVFQEPHDLFLSRVPGIAIWC